MYSRVLLPFGHSLRSATSPKGRGKGCSHGTPKGVELRPLSVRQIGSCLINFQFFGSLLFQKVFDINGEIIGEFMIHNLFSQ